MDLRQIGSVSLVVLSALALASGGAAGAEDKIAPWLAARLAGGERAPFLVLFDSSPSLRALLDSARDSGAAGAVYDALRQRARSRQRPARHWLEARGIPYRTLYVVNGLRVEGDGELARALAARPEVSRLVGDPQVRGVEWTTAGDDPGTDGVEWGISRIRADEVWSQDGVRGEGLVVASADTGVEWDHPALREHYRGWNGLGASHDYHWYDAIDDLAVPLDDHDHGTHTTGTMVGDDGAGNQIGVAPGSRWIACRNMDNGNGRPSTYLDCMQFFLAPWPHGGDPELDGDPSMAPHVVNNSWICPPSEGCDPATLLDGFAALEAAGILAVSSAGNSGPFCSTVDAPPAIYAENLVVGATDTANSLAIFSSRGPVQVDGSGRLRPDLSAPGQSVRSSVRGGGYASFSGTSMAAPHVAGAAALLWSARPELRGAIEMTRCLLTRSAGPMQTPFPQTCGGTNRQDRPNNLFGWGLADAYDAIHLAPDGDGDRIADACDCAPADGGATDEPAEVRGVAVEPDRATLSWESLADQAGPGTVYDLLRGRLVDLVVDGGTQGASCLASDVASTSHADPELPVEGAGFYYLVRGANVCADGSWGQETDGDPRDNSSCP